VPDFDDDEVMTLQSEAVVGYWGCGDRGRRDLPGISLVPHELAAGRVVVHLLDGAGRGDDRRVEPIGEDTGGEPVIPVAVGGDDMGHVLPAGLDPSPTDAAWSVVNGGSTTTASFVP
jgi:hypothetical protein